MLPDDDELDDAWGCCIVIFIDSIARYPRHTHYAQAELAVLESFVTSVRTRSGTQLGQQDQSTIRTVTTDSSRLTQACEVILSNTTRDTSNHNRTKPQSSH
jgi:hypothetical protein